MTSSRYPVDTTPMTREPCAARRDVCVALARSGGFAGTTLRRTIDTSRMTVAFRRKIEKLVDVSGTGHGLLFERSDVVIGALR